MFIALLGLLGLCVGAILRLVAESVRDHDGGGRPRGTCAACGATVHAMTAVPVVGVFHTCAACGHRPHPGRALLDVATAGVFAFLAARVGATWALLPMLLLAAALLAVSAVDLERFRIPDRLLFPSLGAGVVLLLVFSGAGDWTDHLVPALVGMVAYGVILFIPNLIAPAMLGFGDVKLALLLGLFLFPSAMLRREASFTNWWIIFSSSILRENWKSCLLHQMKNYGLLNSYALYWCVFFYFR